MKLYGIDLSEDEAQNLADEGFDGNVAEEDITELSDEEMDGDTAG